MGFLTACGATPSGVITGVKFETLKYDAETGYALFEVDQGVETNLDYKIFPSTAKGYKVRFDALEKGTAENSARFTFKDGKIVVNSVYFEDVKYRVRIDGYGYSDTCIIRLKEYPVEITPDAAEVNINSYETYAINVNARFISTSAVETNKNITENDFNFLVETSDETIVSVPNPHRLKFCAVRNGVSSAKVTVTVLDGNNNPTDLSFEITVNIVPNIGQGFVFVSGSNDLLTNKTVVDEETGETTKTVAEVDIDYNLLSEIGGKKAIKFVMYVVNSVNVLVEEACDYTLELSNTTFATVGEDENGQACILLNNSVTDNYTFKVKICTNLTMKDGSLFTIDIEMTIKKT